MAFFSAPTGSRPTWRQDLFAALSLLAVAVLLPFVTGFKFIGCTNVYRFFGCSNYATPASSLKQRQISVVDTGTLGHVVSGQRVERRLEIAAPRQGGGPDWVDVEWTPPPGAHELSFGGLRPEGLEAGPPYRFAAIAVGSPEAPATLEVSYTAPAGVRSQLNDTFRVVDAVSGGTVHVASFTNPYAGARRAAARSSREATRAGASTGDAQKVASPPAGAWKSRLWLYPSEPTEFTEEMCQQLRVAGADSGGFVAVSYPRSSSGSAAVPIVFDDGLAPRLSVIDYNQPEDEREVLSVNLDLAPARMDWVSNHMPMVEGYEWVTLEPDRSNVPQCPAGFSLQEGWWEFYAETILDYSDDSDGCNGCTLEVYACYEGQELPVALQLALVAGRLPGIGVKTIQADGVTCVGPGFVRLFDMADPPRPAFMLASGSGGYVPQPPERVVFHHMLENNFSSTSYTVNIAVESDLGLQWRFYSNPEATASLSLPISLPGNSGRQFWLAADIPAGVSGMETVRLTATATSAPNDPVRGANFLQIGDWVPPPAPEDQSIWVPVASRAAGVGGSQWRTDVGLLNPGSANATAHLRLYAGGTTHEIQRTVAAGQQRILGDVVGLFGVDGSGAVEIEADQNLIATSRTYSLLAAGDPCYPSGTFGQFLAGVGSSTGLRIGQTGWLPQLAENASYRTNLAVTNTGDQTATVTVILHDAAGAEITRFDLELTPGQWRQENRVFFRRGNRNDLDAASAEIVVTAGSGVLAYASVVDNVTTDPTTIPLVTGGGATTSWVPVASRAAGVGGSQWRTDLGVLNPGTDRANVTVRFHSGGSSSQIQVMVAPGLQRIMEDVVERFTTSGSGSVEVVSTAPVIVTSRTYSLLGASDPCSPGGTFGQFLAGQPSSEGLSAGDSGRLPQLRENAAYRTNLALTNTGATAATATVVLLDAAGVEITRFEVELAPGEWKQENRVFFRRGGRENLGAASARIEVTAGSGVLAYASVVDNVTSDPTTIPLQR